VNREELEVKSKEELISLILELDRKLFDLIKSISEQKKIDDEALKQEIKEMEESGAIVRGRGPRKKSK